MDVVINVCATGPVFSGENLVMDEVAIGFGLKNGDRVSDETLVRISRAQLYLCRDKIRRQEAPS